MKRHSFVAGLAVLLTGAGLTMPPAAPAAAAPADPLVETEVSFTSGDQTLHGAVLAPRGATRRPAVVLVAGAGATDRDDYRPEAEAFAAAGVVTLIYDKRAGYSRATTSFTDLADDALAGLRMLRERPEVAADRVGLWGHSQGGWVVPLAAAKSRDVAFVVTVSASGLTTDRTQLWSNRTRLRHAGVAADLAEPIGVNLSRMLVGAGLFGDTSNDPMANLAGVRQPVLALFAEHDRTSPPAESLALFRQALDRAGNEHYTLRVVAGADHDMRSSPDGYSRSADTDPFAPGYVQAVTGWVAGLAAGPPARAADPAPAQPLTSTPTRPPAWYENPLLHTAAVLVMLVVFLGYLAGALIRRRRADPPRWPGRVLALLGTVTVLGTAVYLFAVVATGATAVGGSVLGRPPAWLGLQLCAVGTVAAAVAVALRRRSAPLLTAAAVFVPWAAYWGLFTA